MKIVGWDSLCVRLKSDRTHSLAPSYRTLFENVDKVVDHEGYANRKALHLKALTVTGLPVEDMPCIEVRYFKTRISFLRRQVVLCDICVQTFSTYLCVFAIKFPARTSSGLGHIRPCVLFSRRGMEDHQHVHVGW
jgi:hypothetical protein